MRSPAIRADEEARLTALREFDALHSDLDPQLDELVELARRLFGVPIALVSLVDRDRQVFAARAGIDGCETARGVSFCAHALGHDEILVVPDARLDPRFAGNPVVTGEPFIRFYAGVPLRTGSGHDVGTVCIVDHAPRNGLSARDRRSLRDLGKLVFDNLELRRLDIARKVGPRHFRNIAATSPDAVLCAGPDGRITFWNEAAAALFGFSEQEALGADIAIVVPGYLRGAGTDGLQRLAAETVEFETKHRDGHVLAVSFRLVAWEENGGTGFGAVVRDAAERRRIHDNLYRLAHQDWQTALPNRAVLMERLREAIAERRPFSLLLLAFEGLQDIDEASGAEGESILRQVTRRMLDCLAGTETLARLGADEFAVLNPSAAPFCAEEAADRMLAFARAPFQTRGGAMHLALHVGISRFPDDGNDAQELIEGAALARLEAQREGRGRRTFNAGLRELALRRQEIDDELRRAFERGEFVLHYQPQVHISDYRVTGAEALIRWQHPTRGLLAPDAFLPALADHPIAKKVGAWVLETACAQAAAWRQTAPDLRIAVNLFEAQVQEGAMHDSVIEVLSRSGLPSAALELEVTETILLRQRRTMFEALRTAGVTLALDDFGTGPASLATLKHYPLDRLKIDRTLIANIVDDHTDALIVNAAAMLARGLGIEVTAEGVETDEQRDAARASGCSSAQGYLFGSPMPAEEFRRFLDGAEQTAVAA